MTEFRHVEPVSEIAAVRRCFAGLAIVCLLCACDQGQEQGPGYVVRDSAGVRIVENTAPRWGHGSGWRLSEQPIVDIGGNTGDPDYELYRVSGALRLSDGRLVVANSGTSELRFFTEEGEYLIKVGGRGEGPGEFGGLTWIHAFGAESMIAYDRRLLRVSVFDTAGRFVRSTSFAPVEGGTVPRLVGMFSDRSFLAQDLTMIGPGPGDATGEVIRRTVSLYRYGVDGLPTDTLGTYLDYETIGLEAGGRMVVSVLVFGRSSHFATHGQQFYVGTNDTYQIEVYSTEGSLTSIVRRAHENLPVTREDVAAIRSERVPESGDPNRRRLLEEAFEAMPVPETMPAFSTIHVDDVGNLWVEEYNRPGDEVPCWTVFDLTGVMLGTMTFPDGLRLLTAGDDYVIGVWQDEIDVEHVQLYELIKP